MFARRLGFAFIAVAGCACLEAVGAQKDKDTPKKKFEVPKDAIAGKVKAVDLKANNFTLTLQSGKDRTFRVDDKTEFWGPKGGDRGTGPKGLKDDCMEKGYEIKVVAAKDGKTAKDVYLPNRKARLGQRGRDQEIENVCRTIRAAGEEGIPMLEWRFWPDFYWDDRAGYYWVEGRGGARCKAFDYTRGRKAPPFPEIGVVGEKEMWGRFLDFARPIVAAAEKANVRLTMHPNDPPVPVMRGVARIFHHTDGLRRFLKEVPSNHSGITFCQGTISEMAGVNVLDEIRHFGRLGKIFLVHFRAVRGKVPRYTEVFIDEGDVDMLQALKAYRAVGFDGPFVSDHTPQVEGDTSWGHRGRTFSHGYMRALVQAVNAT